MPTVSLTMIVRDEEKNLAACLAPVSLLVDEIVIVDTGSVDRTKEIAAAARDKHGRPAKVFDFPWVDDFSAARNESLRHATGDFVFWLDADDRIDAANAELLRQLFAFNLAPAGYVMRTVSKLITGRSAFDYLRLFPRDERFRWRRRVHEDIVWSMVEARLPRVSTDITLTHDTYADPSLMEKRYARNMRLLQLSLDESPDDPETYLRLGVECCYTRRFSAAIAYLSKCLRLLPEPRSAYHGQIYQSASFTLGEAYGRAGQTFELRQLESSLEAAGDAISKGVLQQLRTIFRR